MKKKVIFIVLCALFFIAAISLFAEGNVAAGIVGLVIAGIFAAIAFVKKKGTKSRKATGKNTGRKKEYRGTGMDHHMDAFEKIRVKDKEYDMTDEQLLDSDIVSVYEYNYPVKKFTLQEEPNNEYDKNAVKILADGRHVAYIKKEEAVEVKKALQENNILSIDGFIGGGKFKEIDDDGEKVLKDEKHLFVRLTIYFKS